MYKRQDQALEGSGKRIGNFEEDVLFNRAEAEYKQGDFAAALSLIHILDSQRLHLQPAVFVPAGS